MTERIARVLDQLHLSRRDAIIYVLVIAWVIAMIFVPISRWTSGDEALRFGVLLGAVLQAAASMLLLMIGMGVGRGLLIAAVVVAAAWVIEFVGSHTGFPFGPYYYTQALQPQLGDVPLLVPIAWMMMMPPAWAVTWLLVGRRGRLAFVLVTALIFTTWDLFLDPQMVNWGFWVWPGAGPNTYFGIPWSNYAGWLLSSAVITTLALGVGLKPERIPALPAVIIFTVTWFLETFGLLFFWGLTGPAIVGSIAMGIPMVLAWRVLLRRNRLAATGQE